jgi:hypothetical protein
MSHTYINNSSFRHFCRIRRKRREKSLQLQLQLQLQRLRFRAIGVDSTALARLAARRSLMDSAGFRRILPGDLSAIVAPYSKWQPPAPTIRQKK